MSIQSFLPEQSNCASSESKNALHKYCFRFLDQLAKFHSQYWLLNTSELIKLSQLDHQKFNDCFRAYFAVNIWINIQKSASPKNETFFISY